MEENKELEPQVIQANYKYYKEMTNELSELNYKLISYRNVLEKVFK